MKYITVPEPQTLVDADGTPVQTLDYKEFLASHVWSAPVWRDSLDSNNLLVDAMEKFKGCESGDVVGIEDAAYEIFKPLATLKGEKLHPSNTEQLNVLVRAALTAKNKVEEVH